MTCEQARELLALRLYDELDPGDDLRLDLHRQMCAACRAFAAELERGLGALARDATRADDSMRVRLASDEREAPLRPASVPAGLQERARPGSRRLRVVERGSLLSAGVAAGLLAALLAGRLAPPERADGEDVAQVASAFERAGPPPAARTRGRFTRLGDLVRR